MAKRGRKPKKTEEVKEKDVKVEKIKSEKVKKEEPKKERFEKVEIQEELFNDDFEDAEFEEYDDEEDDDEMSHGEETNDLEESDEEVVAVKSESNELKNIKLISIVSLCVSVVTLILTLVILSNVTDGNRNYASSSGSGSGDSSTDESETVEYDVSRFEAIDADEFIDMFDEKDETYFVYTGRSTCGYCVQFVPVLNQSLEEYDYTVHYLDVSTVDNNAYSEIIELDEILEANFGYTPMVFVVQDGKVVDVNEGYSEYSTYSQFLEENDVDKK